MARKYLCDCCGAEFDKRHEVRFLKWRKFAVDPEAWHVIGEYCLECLKKIEARVHEGIQ